MDLSAQFHIAAASLTGREHLRRNRNNQDAVAIEAASGRIAAVIADGCGEASRSEIGAVLGARFLAGWLARSDEAEDLRWAEAACDALTEYLRTVARGSWSPERNEAFVAEHLLFTFLAAVVTPARFLVFGCGDGVVRVDHTLLVLDSGPDNAPEYLGYRLTESKLVNQPRMCDVRPRVHVSGERFSRLVIGTDGLVPLLTPEDAIDRLTREVAASGNATLLQRGFVLLRDRERRVQDDATAALLIRKEDL
jgi:serine/threonine protein phosphatase PrpC